MAITFVDKEEHIVIRVVDGHDLRHIVALKDTVISVPPDGYRKVHNIYVDPVTERLFISYED